MVRYISTTIAAFALAGMVSASAQQPAPTPAPAPAPAPAPTPAPAQPEQAENPKETVTGCVMEAKTTDGGTAYVLNKAEGGTAKMYVLASATPSEFSTKVNKKVEVTGPVQQPHAPSEHDAAGKPTVLRPPSVQVEAVKVIAETCQ
jgi:hypothetical protein